MNYIEIRENNKEKFLSQWNESDWHIWFDAIRANNEDAIIDAENLSLEDDFEFINAAGDYGADDVLDFLCKRDDEKMAKMLNKEVESFLEKNPECKNLSNEEIMQEIEKNKVINLWHGLALYNKSDIECINNHFCNAVRISSQDYASKLIDLPWYAKCFHSSLTFCLKDGMIKISNNHCQIEPLITIGTYIITKGSIICNFDDIGRYYLDSITKSGLDFSTILVSENRTHYIPLFTNEKMVYCYW